MKYSNYKRIHFIGIGGIGMSAIAYVLIKRGALVSGSDVEESSITEKLKKIGAKIYIGHKKTNIIEPLDLVIYSSCIRKNNPEIQAAQTLGIPTALRGEVLAWLMNEKIGISIAGTHGKTTTTSLIGTILKGTDLKPTILVGGEVPSLGGNAVFGEGNYLVAESDESDGSFLALRPTYSVVTNLDEDHLDYHKDKKGLVKAFIQYVSNTKQDGCLIYWYDEPQKHSLLKAFNGRKVSFGLDKGADISAGNIELQKDFTVFVCYKSGERLGEIKLPLGGKHNCRNALAAIAVAIDIGVDFKEIKKSLESFSGVKRRFQIKGTYNGVMLVEDYAHHPTEIESVLAQARLWRPNRLISVFQVIHKTNRTKYNSRC